MDKKLLKHPTFVEDISLKLYACDTYVYYFSPGYFCDNANGPIGNLSNYECPMGYYCPGSVNRSNEYPCSAGTYNNRTMLVSDSECQPCLPGYYCQNPGLPEPEGLCYPGWVVKMNIIIPRQMKFWVIYRNHLVCPFFLLA